MQTQVEGPEGPNFLSVTKGASIVSGGKHTKFFQTPGAPFAGSSLPRELLVGKGAHAQHPAIETFGCSISSNWSCLLYK